MSWRGTLPRTCWQATEAERIILTEADAPSDAVFLATHSSLPIFQRDHVTDAKRMRRTDEHGLLAAVLAQPADQPILPILGRSGTGKSHLVRWLSAKLPASPSRRVIFVPKHRMSLRGILDLILERATSDRAHELRQKVAKAVEGIANDHEAKLRLRSELAVLVETRGTRTDVPADEQDLREWLASSEGLPALLSDPVFRDRLFDKQSPISRLVREKLTGKGTEDKEEAFGFAAHDLAMSVDDLSRASAAASTVAAELTSGPELRELAATMLNEQLNPAVSQVFGIGGEDLKELLVEARVELNRQGLELLLLIEDFSIFQGIQGGLLDAITLLPTQNNDVCPMRVVMAVTTGYFVNQMPDTVKTRVYKVFDLDDPNPQVSFDPAAVGARYMNAIRVGTQRLEDVHAGGDETPNACDQCPVNDACHQAFGSVEGYGLFPFNHSALRKTVRSKLVDDRLSVRDYLTRVLRPVLSNYHDEIEQGTFPNAEFDAAFHAGAMGTLDSVEDQHQLATPGDAEMSQRRVSLVRYWGPGGSRPHNLQPTIHEAFGIPPLHGLPDDADADVDNSGHVIDGPPPPAASPVPTPPAPPRPTEEPPLVRAVDTWHRKGQLSQRDRNSLRQIIHTTVTARLALEDGCGGPAMWANASKPWETAFDAQNSIKFDDQSMPHALITIDKDDTNSVRALRALAWVNTTGDWNSVPYGYELQLLVEEQIAAWTTAVSEALLPHRDQRDDPELVVATHTLLAMSKALGVADAFKDDALSRTRALFAPTEINPNAPRPVLAQWQKRVSDDHQRLSRGHLQDRVLRLASFTQGSGSPLALDLPRVTKALRGKDSGSDLPPAMGLLAATAQAVHSLQGRLPVLREEVVSSLPDLSDLGGELPDVIKQLEKLVSERASAGQLPTSLNPSALLPAGRAIKPGDQKRVENVRAKIDDWDQLSVDDRIRVLTDDWDEAAARVRRWHTLATTAMQSLEAKYNAQAQSAAQLEYDQARSNLIDALKTVAGLLEFPLEIQEMA